MTQIPINKKIVKSLYSYSLEFCVAKINNEVELYVLIWKVIHDVFIMFFKKQVAKCYV